MLASSIKPQPPGFPAPHHSKLQPGIRSTQRANSPTFIASLRFIKLNGECEEPRQARGEGEQSSERA
ncbi:hypothetical protein ACQJBY_043642 [Aegilops geniculata]